VRRFVEQYAREYGFSAEVVDQMCLVVDEACSNVMRHAYGEENAGPIDILVDWDEDKFLIIIRDEGASFDFEKYQKPDLERSIKRRRAGGFGVHIMKRLMDSVEYVRRGRFNEVVLVKLRESETE